MINLSTKSAEEFQLPELPQFHLAISQLTQALGIPRDLLASDEEIEYAWKDLPRELRNIPITIRGELMARMCVAVSTGCHQLLLECVNITTQGKSQKFWFTSRCSNY